jgi:hypothetical protein
MKRFPDLNKNITALFVLGFVLALLLSVGGGFILGFGYFRAPGATIPIWKFGQFMMFCGFGNLFVLVCLCFQIRNLFKADKLI